MTSTKRCTACGVDKGTDQFYKKTGGGLRAICVACYAISNAQQREKHADKRLAYDAARGPGWERSGRERWEISEPQKWAGHIKRAYGITVDRVRQMFDAQSGRCAICYGYCNRSTTRRLSIDHDHGTGDVRALLCFKCNVGLGRFNDNPALLDAAARYLRKHARPNRILIYLSGPMSGLPLSNYPAFNAAAKELRSLGHFVENPAENFAPPDTPWEEFMRIGIIQLLRCEAIALLPGWQSSRGASLEVHIARTLGMRIGLASEFADARDKGAVGQARSGA